jgi:hypothetical protein
MYGQKFVLTYFWGVTKEICYKNWVGNGRGEKNPASPPATATTAVAAGPGFYA